MTGNRLNYVLALYSLGIFLYCFLKAAENLLALAYPSFPAISAIDKLLPASKTSDKKIKQFLDYIHGDISDEDIQDI